ncbi:MAG: ubiquitin-like domain-containing protein [Candidatus Hodarchaeales archaeon]|jgi:hypothetical protein
MSDFEDFDIDIASEEESVMAPSAIKSKTPESAKTPATSRAGPKKNVFFRSTVGPERTEKLAVGENTPVADVKETLSNVFGLTPDDFHLSHAGRTLNEDSPIGDYGVDNGDEILMIPHSTAG